MGPIARLRAWFRWIRRRQALRKAKGPLREFVYLDEVSVYSLIASRLGPIATEFTETQTTSLQGGLDASVSADWGIVKGEAKPHGSIGHTQGSQVVKKSIVQTTFKELYQTEVRSLAIRPVGYDDEPPEVRGLGDLEAASRMAGSEGWIVDPSDLIRGRLLEVEVELEAELIYKLSTVVSALVDIVEGSSGLLAPDFEVGLVQMRAVDRIMDKLLVGLVPVRGRVTDYRIVQSGGKEWIVHCKVLGLMKGAQPSETRPLCLVGLAEERLFWRDIRRVLFAKARFRVLCRIARDGLQDSWNPVQLAQVLEAVVPGMPTQLDGAGSGALARAAESNKPNPGLDLKQQSMQKVLVGYAARLAEHYDLSIAPEELGQLNLLSWQYCASCGSQKERRAAFDVVGEFVLGRRDVEVDPSILAECRAAALEEAGLDPFGQLMPLTAAAEAGPMGEPSDVRFLESEFVAIYW